MQLNEYQARCHRFDTFYPTEEFLERGMLDKILGLVGESGEVADKFKKISRDCGAEPSQQDYHEIAKELGDVFWYLAELSHYLGYSLEEIAQMNLHKLEDRFNRNCIHGSGDNR